MTEKIVNYKVKLLGRTQLTLTHLLTYSLTFIILMYFIIAFQIYFILVVYSYFESLREDPSGSIAGFVDGRGTVMVCYSSMPLCPM